MLRGRPGSFTGKRFSSEKRETAQGDWRHVRIILSPTNRDYEPIEIPAEATDDFRIVAEFVAVLRET